MKNLTTAFLLLAGLATFSGCDDDDDTTITPPVTNMTVSGNLTSAKIFPGPVTAAGAAATGTLTGSYNKDTKILTYSITYANTSGPLTSGHFHLGAAGVKGGPFVTFTDLTRNPITGTTAALTDAQRDALLSGGVYANLHTAANPDGEVRTQVEVK